jgi:hypothetical protein
MHWHILVNNKEYSSGIGMSSKLRVENCQSSFFWFKSSNILLWTNGLWPEVCLESSMAPSNPARAAHCPPCPSTSHCATFFSCQPACRKCCWSSLIATQRLPTPQHSFNLQNPLPNELVIVSILQEPNCENTLKFDERTWRKQDVESWSTYSTVPLPATTIFLALSCFVKRKLHNFFGWSKFCLQIVH